MDCCQHCESIEHEFDFNNARLELDDYHSHGPQSTTRILVSALIEQGVADKTLLDIGGGIGAIQHELFKAGIRYATNLEASHAYLQVCQEESIRQGHGDRVHHLHGNFAEMHNLPKADIVTMERVICCYPDMDTLVGLACQKARHLLGLVYPHESWWVKLGVGWLNNIKYRFKHDPFRVYLHCTEQVKNLVLTSAFRQVYYRKSGAWQVFVYEKSDGPT